MKGRKEGREEGGKEGGRKERKCTYKLNTAFYLITLSSSSQVAAKDTYFIYICQTPVSTVSHSLGNSLCSQGFDA